MEINVQVFSHCEMLKPSIMKIELLLMCAQTTSSDSFRKYGIDFLKSKLEMTKKTNVVWREDKENTSTMFVLPGV